MEGSGKAATARWRATAGWVAWSLRQSYDGNTTVDRSKREGGEGAIRFITSSRCSVRAPNGGESVGRVSGGGGWLDRI